MLLEAGEPPRLLSLTGLFRVAAATRQALECADVDRAHRGAMASPKIASRSGSLTMVEASVLLADGLLSRGLSALGQKRLPLVLHGSLKIAGLA